MTRKELSQVYYLDKELKQREKQLAELIEESQIKSPAISGMPFANTNDVSDKVARTAVKIVEYTQEVEIFRQALQIRKQAIDRWVMSLEDAYLRQIIYYRYYELLSWSKIEALMGGSQDSIRMYLSRAIPKE